MPSAETRHRLITSTVAGPRRYIESHILPWLLTFTTTREPSPAMRAARSNGFVSLPGLTATQARSRTTTVARGSSPAICRANFAAVAMSAASRASGARRGQHTAAGISGLRMSSNPPVECLPIQNACDGPNQRVVFFSGNESRSFASFQSGRMELKILLCFTCPASPRG